MCSTQFKKVQDGQVDSLRFLGQKFTPFCAIPIPLKGRVQKPEPGKNSTGRGVPPLFCNQVYSIGMLIFLNASLNFINIESILEIVVAVRKYLAFTFLPGKVTDSCKGGICSGKSGSIVLGSGHFRKAPFASV